MKHLFKHHVYLQCLIFFSKHIPFLNNNALYYSLRIKGVSKKSKYHKDIHSTYCDKLLYINVRSTDVYKIAAALLKSTPPPRKIHNNLNLNADYQV